MPVSCVLTVLPGCAVQKSCDVFSSGSSRLCLPLRVLSQPHPLPTFTDGRTWHSLRGLAGLGQRPGPYRETTRFLPCLLSPFVLRPLKEAGRVLLRIANGPSQPPPASAWGPTPRAQDCPERPPCELLRSPPRSGRALDEVGVSVGLLRVRVNFCV